MVTKEGHAFFINYCLFRAIGNQYISALQSNKPLLLSSILQQELINHQPLLINREP